MPTAVCAMVTGLAPPQLGSGLAVGQTAESIAAALDALTQAKVDWARKAALLRRDELDWSRPAGPTADLFEATLLNRGQA